MGNKGVMTWDEWLLYIYKPYDFNKSELHEEIFGNYFLKRNDFSKAKTNSCTEVNSQEENVFIYNVVTERFQLEFERTQALDEKASSIIGFVGIIIGLDGALGSSLLKDVPKDSGFHLSSGILISLSQIFFSGIILLFCSLLCGLIVYGVKNFQIVPNTKNLIKNYVDKNIPLDKMRVELYMIKSDVVNENWEINKRKTIWLKIAMVLLTLGILANILFIYGLLK